MLALIAVCAALCMFLNVANFTIRCDFGKTSIIGGYLPSGTVVHVMSLQPNGEYETVAENVLVIAEERWQQEKGSSICYIDLRMSLIQKWSVEGYPNYRVDLSMRD